MLRLSLLLLALASPILPAYAADKVERRCGWFERPSPANATLTDRDGTWTIGTQGGYQAQGDWPPHFAEGQWIATNGEYGYGCSCFTASVDTESRRLNHLTKTSARPLAACRNDPSLQEPTSRQASPQQAAAQSSLKVYQAEGFSFSYPKGWAVSQHQECLRLTAPGSRSKEEEYTVQLCVQHGTLEQATEQMVFSLDDGVWMRHAGMQSASPVDLFNGPGWKGMQAVQVCGIGDEETGWHAAGGDCLMAIVYTPRIQLLFDTLGYYQEFDIVSAIVRSVRFVEKL